MSGIRSINPPHQGCPARALTDDNLAELKAGQAKAAVPGKLGLKVNLFGTGITLRLPNDRSAATSNQPVGKLWIVVIVKMTLFSFWRVCHRPSMADVPKKLPTGPISLTCPFCGAKPNQDCFTTSGSFSAIHLVRVKAAGISIVKRKRERNAALKPQRLRTSGG
jgi:hypothetical protein